ncbi:hypothetical protein BT96DRAFT_451078 [Gymnopus androsaceus JB14]|uniref:Uncharacterized protein n=1 Tax=Gymnopus androsaceus JB14 TaxID=1447944 RepID=A0A6A4GRK7_9AGAR|nr:hypothetical protein BT96DRAFT_451078 [Gymnopus androsaceus JB14]
MRRVNRMAEMSSISIFSTFQNLSHSQHEVFTLVRMTAFSVLLPNLEPSPHLRSGYNSSRNPPSQRIILLGTPMPNTRYLPATVTRDSDDDPETFAVAYLEDSDPKFTSFVATPTDTNLPPQTVLFSIATPGSVTSKGVNYEYLLFCFSRVVHLEVTDATVTKSEVLQVTRSL